MNDSDQDALDPEMVSLLRAEFAPASAEVKERVSNRLAQSAGALALSRATGAPQIPVASSPAPLLAALRAHSLGFAATFVLGTAFGSGLYAATRRAEPMQLVYVERPVAQAPTPVSRAAIAPPLLQSAAPPEPAPAPTAVSMPSASAEHVGPASLAEQQALLDIARRDFARSDYAATLDALNAHFRRYPKSVLGEERDALEIKALAASGRDAEARGRATRFKAQFPQSLLLPSVEDSVGTIP
jgi:hypothetical protein